MFSSKKQQDLYMKALGLAQAHILNKDYSRTVFKALVAEFSKIENIRCSTTYKSLLKAALIKKKFGLI